MTHLARHCHPPRYASPDTEPHRPSAVGLLETRTRGAASELLRLAAARVSDDEGAVVRHQDVLDFFLRGLIDELLVVGDHALGDGLAQGVDLRGVTAALHAEPNVDLPAPLLAHQQQRLEDFDAEDVGLHRVDGATIHAGLPGAGADERDRHGVLLAAEALDLLALGFRHLSPATLRWLCSCCGS